MSAPAAQAAGGAWGEVLVIVVLACAGVALWTWLFARPGRAARIVPWQPRRPVPWSGFHVAVIVCLYLGAMVSIPSYFVLSALPPQKDTEEAAARSTEHPAALLARDATDLGTVLLCVLSAAVMAPLCEEFVFRLVLQGWLEKRWLRRVARPERAWREAAPQSTPFQGVPHGVARGVGVVPVVVVAAIFAAIHFRTAKPPEDLATIRAIMVGSAAAHLFTLIAGLCVLRLDAQATLVDLGYDGRKLPADLKLGLLGLLAIATVVYPLQYVMTCLFEKTGVGVAADPIALFVFALLLGVLYLRTHRIGPSIVVHVGLNLTSLMLVRF